MTVKFARLREKTANEISVIVEEDGNRNQSYMGAIRRDGSFFHGLIRPIAPYTAEFHRILARKQEEVVKFGLDPDTCKNCGGSPHFPNPIAKHACPNEMHKSVFQ
jgi:hypothetical protein